MGRPERRDDRATTSAPPGAGRPGPGEAAPVTVIRRGPMAWLRRNARRLWWLHSIYALALGVFVVLFAAKGFQHTRWLAALLVAAWLLLVVAFRVFGSGARQDQASRRGRIGFTALSFALKNLYQAMLFFLLPFYWESTTLGAMDQWFGALLVACAVISTLDLPFDRYLMRWRPVAGLYFGVTLFACLQLMTPLVVPALETRWRLLGAAAVATLGAWTLLVPLRSLLRPGVAALVALSLAGTLAGAWYGRAAIPPVPLSVAAAAVGDSALADGRVAVGVTSIHEGRLGELVATTDVRSPAGVAEALEHRWRCAGRTVHHATPLRFDVDPAVATARLQSVLPASALPADPVGPWTVDVVTPDGQLVGRARFRVFR